MSHRTRLAAPPLLSLQLLVLGLACSDEQNASSGTPPGERPSGWSEPTHGNAAAPSYAALFDDSRVQRIDLRIAAADYELMQSDLTALVGGRPVVPNEPFCYAAQTAVPCTLPPFLGGGEGACGLLFGQSWVCMPTSGPISGGGAGVAGSADAGADETADSGAPVAPFPGPPGGSTDLIARDPIYVPVEVLHDGTHWTQVGMRYKGNSSLAISGGRGKLPFRLNFDHYEAEHPEIEDQRFYGFKEMTFSSNWNDDSQLRELFAGEVLRDRGIPVARAAFARVYVDAGGGPEYWGLYTMLEDPSDALTDAQFGSSSGNLYKPDGPGADWTEFAAEGFVKKNNEQAADWSDVEGAIAALHAAGVPAEGWRAGLEAAFDVDGFLGWLAVNTVIVNWDTYGAIAHNYYLYGDPARGGQLRWIPWDHNLSMAEGGAFGAEPLAAPAVEIFHAGVGAEWPLISKLLADPVYAERYRAGVEHALAGLFTPELGGARLRELHALIEPYVTGAEAERETHRTISSAEAFATSIDGPDGLAAYIAHRRVRAEAALLAP